MKTKDKIDIDIFKAVNSAISESEDLEIMAVHLCQLLTAALEIKGSSIFVLNPETHELENLASFGLSKEYVNKGPLEARKSLKKTLRGEVIVIRNIKNTKELQYPREAKKEGIASLSSIPIRINKKVIAELRLYHSKPWALSDRDVDSLRLLGETIGLALMYTRLLNALRTIRSAVGDIHSIWLDLEH
ncbi:MAG: GAF domain-containing protein [Thermodesulfobacteriota bacterium]